MTHYGYKFRIYPDEVQTHLIHKTLGCVRLVYNEFLAQRITQYDKDGTSSSYVKDSKKLTALKSQEAFSFLHEVDSTALQTALRHLDTAYTNFFKHKTRFPKFKKKTTSRQSYTTKFSHNNIAIVKDGIKLPKLDIVRAALHRRVEGRIMSATVRRLSTGKYECSVLVDKAILPWTKTGKVLGLDMGLTTLVAGSDGVKIDNPRHLKTAEKALVREQRRLSRKQKGSKNQVKARQKLALRHARVANARRDYCQKLSNNIVKNHDIVVTEDLAVKNMVKNRRLSKGISDAGWSSLITMLDYKCKLYGKEHIKIDRFFASSKLCSTCGYKNNDLGLDVRNWQCPACNAYHDRDINSAVNILNEGLRIRTSTVGLTGINACGDYVRRDDMAVGQGLDAESAKQEKEMVLDTMKPLPQKLRHMARV